VVVVACGDSVGGGGGVGGVGGRSKRLERALIAMWQLYGDSKDGAAAAGPSSSRHLFDRVDHDYQPAVGSPLRFGGGDESLISMSDLRLPSTPSNLGQHGHHGPHDRNDSVVSAASSSGEPHTPVNWDHLHSLVDQGEQMAMQQSRFEEQLETANKHAEEQVSSKWFWGKDVWFGTGWYWLVLVGTGWYWLVLVGTGWYWLVYWLVLVIPCYYLLVLCCSYSRWYWLVLVGLLVGTCYSLLLLVGTLLQLQSYSLELFL